MAAIMRGVVTAAFAAMIAGAFQVSAPAAYAAPSTRVMCERVNEVGDCEELPPNQRTAETTVYWSTRWAPVKTSRKSTTLRTRWIDSADRHWAEWRLLWC